MDLMLDTRSRECNWKAFHVFNAFGLHYNDNKII